MTDRAGDTDDKKYTEGELLSLRERVRPYLTEKRYLHTLSVEGEAAYMAARLLPEREGEVRAAALLHDIAKKLSYENQLNYIREFGIISLGETPVGEVAHAPAGAAMIRAHFPEFAEPDILSAVAFHSTGRREMTVFEAIIFLADYVEPTRTHESCKNTRAVFHARFDAAVCREDAVEALRECTVRAMRQTVEYVRKNNMELDGTTLTALSYLENGGELADTLTEK